MGYNRQRIRPGIGGASANAIDLSEATNVENMRLRRDGTWVPRWGLEQVTTGTNITRVWNHPARNDIIFFVDNGALKYWNGSAAFTLAGPTLLGAHTEPAIGFGADLGAGAGSFPQLYSMLWNNLQNTNGTTLYAVDRYLNIGTITGPASGKWLGNHGRMTTSTDGEAVHFSDANDSTNWTGNEINAPADIGNVVALLPYGEGLSLILGTYGMGLVRAGDESNLAVESVNAVPTNYDPQGACRIAEGVAWLAPGPRLMTYQGSVSSIAFPVQEEIEELGVGSRCWYNQDENQIHIFCDFGANPDWVYIYDLDRQRWLGRWADQGGVGNIHGIAYELNSQRAYRDFYFGSGTNLLKASIDNYDDLGVAFTCKVETKPDDFGIPEKWKQAQGVYLDGKGTWTVDLHTRSDPKGAWSSALTTPPTVVAPGFCHFNNEAIWGERKLVMTCSSASDVCIRSVHPNDRILGLK